mmetsp:Transcript_17747/g.24657  ORF Transcript_17747/g.24657 Transcript_17747/m.24657 type:complete len:165 (+) Transcript_17747:100-594(+)
MRRAVTQILSKRTNLMMNHLPVAQQASASRWMSSNITYSGGQASEGQGGFYGSGGARATKVGDGTERTEHRPELLALAGDVQKIVEIMNEVEILENLLLNDDPKNDAVVSNKTIEIRTNIKKLMTSKDFRESLDRLEIEGQPVWGLSSDERDLITQARAKMNEC